MNHDLRTHFARWLDAHGRTAWVPLTEPGDGPPATSKFGGTPWLGHHEEWPTCDVCRRPLELLVQLDLPGLPGQAGGNDTGLFQAFYCTWLSCPNMTGWEPFGGGQLVRVIDRRGGGRGVRPAVGAGDDIRLVPPARIVGWQPVDDEPSPREHWDLGLRTSYPAHDRPAVVEWAAGGVRVEIDDPAPGWQISRARHGDKLLGWPDWVQDAYYPPCRRCGRRMEFFFQLDGCGHVRGAFGNDACGHVTRCPDHLRAVAFGWNS